MNKNTILNFLEYSALAYRNIQPDAKNETLTVINTKKTDVKCFVRRTGNILIITFRGSSSDRDWRTNFKFHKKTIPYGNDSSKIKVHTGFLQTYKSKTVRCKIHELIDDEIEKIQITGHSLGAALATLCAVDLQFNFPNKDYEVLLFGSPRVGNKAFKKSYNKRVFKTVRIVNKADIVTKVPLAAMGYHHVGTKLTFRRWFDLPFAISFKQHTLQEYYKNFLK